MSDDIIIDDGPGGKEKHKKGSSTHKKTLNGKQKAAIFLVTLGADVSSEVFKHLREQDLSL